MNISNISIIFPYISKIGEYTEDSVNFFAGCSYRGIFAYFLDSRMTNSAATTYLQEARAFLQKDFMYLRSGLPDKDEHKANAINQKVNND